MTPILRFRFTKPTNRAGMNGIGPCSSVLDDSTATQLKGTAAADASCYWKDDSTLVAQLTMESLATSGMAVGVRPNVLWPKAWPYPGSCYVVGSMCVVSGGAGSNIAVDKDFPCDTKQTPATREQCIVPTALIQAPNEIDSCPGTSITLDATPSTGGGVRPLTYSWSANPRSTDNYYQVAAKLAAGGTAASSIELGSAELDNGRSFNLRLVVTSFLGISSAPFTARISRSAMPVPKISVQAPPLMEFPRSATVTLEASASIAACFASNGTGSSIGFVWSHTASIGNNTNAGGLFVVDPASSVRRDLIVRGASLKPGVRYTLRVAG